MIAGTGAVHPAVAPSPPDRLLRFEIPDSETEVGAELERDLTAARRRIEAFFGRPFTDPVRVEVYGSRAGFTGSFPPEWGMTETACWMVAAGVADRLIVLSPRVWKDEACEHDPHDAAHVRNLLAHELVHVFHGQHNPTRDFTGAEEVGWFAEGLAVYVSGQLEEGHVAPAREAIERGQAPAKLADAWSGKYRYGVSGSLVAWLDATLGRAALTELLAVTREQELLAVAGRTESELLADWRSWVLAQAAP